MKVWLITWEWLADYCKPDKKIVAILSSRKSHYKVKELVELLYATKNYNIQERTSYIKKPSRNPYQAYWGKYPRTGVDWLDYIYCGHHPWLYARKVEILEITETKRGTEKITWKETLPNLSGEKTYTIEQ